MTHPPSPRSRPHPEDRPGARRDREDTGRVVREVISTILPDLAPSEITGDKHLRDLGADSVDRVEIVMSLIDRFRVDRPMSGFADVPHIDALTDLLHRIRRR